jgi:hypothetical protein
MKYIHLKIHCVTSAAYTNYRKTWEKSTGITALTVMKLHDEPSNIMLQKIYR